jgi:hypothetical protein
MEKAQRAIVSSEAEVRELLNTVLVGEIHGETQASERALKARPEFVNY